MEWVRAGLPNVDHAQRVGRLLGLSALMGVVAGLAACGFEVLVGAAKYGLLDSMAGFRPPTAAGDHPLFGHSSTPYRPWVLALLPVVGGLIGGAFVYGLAPDADGPGTEAAIDAFHHRRGVIRKRVPFVKGLASALTLGTGGSAGREGPIALIGAGLGSILALWLRLSVRDRRILMVAGLAAGIGAIFRAPLAAALFSAEVLYREMEMEFEVIVPSVISSIIGYSVFTILFGPAPLFTTPGFSFTDPRQLLPYSVLALVSAGGAWMFAQIFSHVQRTFRKLRLYRPLKPALGGVVVGAFALVAPETIGSGYGLIQEAFEHELSLGILVLVAFGKMVTTAFTVGSGQSGGVFGPAVVVGGALGGVVALACRTFMPALVPETGAFIMVGMAGFFAAAANTPLSSIIMVSEMTGNYRLLVPTMWVCVIAFLLMRRHSLYEGQVARRSDSPVHLGEMMQDTLQRLTVEDALREVVREPLISVDAGTPLKELSERFASSHHAVFPVVDDSGSLVGVIDEEALRLAICMDHVDHVIVAHDLIESAPFLVPQDSLQGAMHKMVASGHDELIVVDGTDPQKIVGSLSRRDLIAAYDHAIQRDLEDRMKSGLDLTMN